MRTSILFAIAQWTLFINGLQSQNPIAGYMYIGSHEGNTYYLSLCTATWQQAHEAASEMGGYLAAITDLEENDFLEPYVPAEGAWIGYATTYSGWSNGEAFNFDHFDYYYVNAVGYGVILSEEENGFWALSEQIEYNSWTGYPIRYIVEFDTNPDCNNSNKAYLCHNGVTVCVSLSSFASHLAHGDYAGPCSGCNDPDPLIAPHQKDVAPSVFNDMHAGLIEPESSEDFVNSQNDTAMKSTDCDDIFIPNPLRKDQLLQIISPIVGACEVVISDMQGKRIIHLNDYRNTWPMKLLTPGIYVCQLIINNDQQLCVQTTRLVMLD